MLEPKQGHTYPSNYPPGRHWATDAAWEILDTLPVGLLDEIQRPLIAGMITGALLKAAAKRKE